MYCLWWQMAISTTINQLRCVKHIFKTAYTDMLNFNCLEFARGRKLREPTATNQKNNITPSRRLLVPIKIMIFIIMAGLISVSLSSLGPGWGTYRRDGRRQLVVVWVIRASWDPWKRWDRYLYLSWECLGCCDRNLAVICVVRWQDVPFFLPWQLCLYFDKFRHRIWYEGWRVVFGAPPPSVRPDLSPLHGYCSLVLRDESNVFSVRYSQEFSWYESEIWFRSHWFFFGAGNKKDLYSTYMNYWFHVTAM